MFHVPAQHVSYYDFDSGIRPAGQLPIHDADQRYVILMDHARTKEVRFGTMRNGWISACLINYRVSGTWLDISFEAPTYAEAEAWATRQLGITVPPLRRVAQSPKRDYYNDEGRALHLERADQLEQRARELKAEGSDEAMEHAHDLEVEAAELRHYVALDDMDDAR